MTEPTPQINPTKVRIGLALISVIFVASIVLIATVDNNIGQAIFFAVAAMTLVRGALLVRWLRKQSKANV